MNWERCFSTRRALFSRRLCLKQLEGKLSLFWSAKKLAWLSAACIVSFFSFIPQAWPQNPFPLQNLDQIEKKPVDLGSKLSNLAFEKGSNQAEPKNVGPATTFFCSQSFSVQGSRISFSNDFDQIRWDENVVFNSPYATLNSSNISLTITKEGYILRTSPIYNSRATLELYNNPTTLPTQGNCRNRSVLRPYEENYLVVQADHLEWVRRDDKSVLRFRGKTRLSDRLSSLVLITSGMEVTFEKEKLVRIWVSEPLDLVRENENFSIKASQALFDGIENKVYLVGSIRSFYLARALFKAQRIVLDFNNEIFSGSWVEALLTF